MSTPNPTVALNVTARELSVLTNLLGYNTGCTTLRDKLTEAGKDMRLATRQKNREVKLARKAREAVRQ